MTGSGTIHSMRFGFLLVLGLLAAAPGPAQGDNDDDSKEVSTRQLGDDRFVAGNDVRLTGEVAGDAIAAGGEVVVDALVRGDVVATGGEVTVRGTASEDLYAAAGKLYLDGRVVGNARVAGGDVTLHRGATIEGGASVAGGDIRIEGHVGKYLQIAGGKLRIDGIVDGDVEAAGGELVVGPATVIRGSLTFRGRKAPRIEDGAQIRGGVEHIVEKRRGHWKHWARLAGLFAAIWLAGWLIVAAVLLAVWPGFARSVSETVSGRPGMSALIGFVVLIGGPVLIAMLMASFVGIPLAILLLFLYLLLLPLGYLAAALTIAEGVLTRMRKGAQIATRHRVFALLGVLVVLFFLTQIPFLGALLGLALFLVGIGGLVLTATARHRATPATGAA